MFQSFKALRGRLLAGAAIIMERSAHDWLIDVDIAVPDFQVIAAFGIGADPGLILNVCSLASEI